MDEAGKGIEVLDSTDCIKLKTMVDRKYSLGTIYNFLSDIYNVSIPIIEIRKDLTIDYSVLGHGGRVEIANYLPEIQTIMFHDCRFIDNPAITFHEFVHHVQFRRMGEKYMKMDNCWALEREAYRVTAKVMELAGFEGLHDVMKRILREYGLEKVTVCFGNQLMKV